MHLKGNTILITGGSSGIGLELANRLQQKGNTIIICGRSTERLEQSKKINPALITYSCDLSDPVACKALVDWLKATHPALNVLVNNAAIAHTCDFRTDPDILDKATKEIAINLMAPIQLSKMVLPILERNNRPVIINVTTGLVYSPRAQYPIYNATKAALHSFTQVLRLQLESSSVDIIEVLFPAVDTPWHKGNPPKIAIAPEKAVEEMISGLKKGSSEIRVGGVKLLYMLTRVAPGIAFRKINSL